MSRFTIRVKEGTITQLPDGIFSDVELAELNARLRSWWLLSLMWKGSRPNIPLVDGSVTVSSRYGASKDTIYRFLRLNPHESPTAPSTR